FTCYLKMLGDLQHLHSFPTRRSSDLASGMQRFLIVVKYFKLWRLQRKFSAKSLHPSGCRNRQIWFDRVRQERLIEPGNFNVTGIDRKSTRLNSSHRTISYAVFCLKDK